MKRLIFKFTGSLVLGRGRATWTLFGVLLAASAMDVSGQIVAYEANDWPENVGWTRVPFCDPPRRLIDGWFEQQVAPCPGDPLPGGQQEELRRGLGEFVESNKTFFLEWRAETDGPASEISGVAPASMVIADSFSSYHFTFAREQIRMIRTNLLPILYYPLVPGEPHTYRLELYNYEGPVYVLYIDGQLIEQGVPEGVFPRTDSAVISFQASCWYEPSTTRWDYVRFGVIPNNASGDYDSDWIVTLFDFYFFHECLTNTRPGINGGPDEDAGPGCRFADFDADGDVDLQDLAAFQNAFTGAH